MTKEKCKDESSQDSDIKYLYGYSEQKDKIAKFFEYDHDFLSSPYISRVNVFVGCEIESCDFGIEIYSVGENVDPGSQINHEEIIGQALEGKNWTTIDVSEHCIKFPKKGLFIVLKWLKTDDNLYEYSGRKKDPNKRYTYSTYAPQFGTYPKENRYLWVYNDDSWKKAERNKLSILRKYEGKHTVPAIELEFESLQT